MTVRAEASFTIVERHDEPVEFEGAELVRARWRKSFTGEVSGESDIETVMCTMTEAGARVYVGVERMNCAVHGRKGTFLIMHAATMLGTDHQSRWTVVPGSGTGELAGISGEAQILPNHAFILEYSLPE